MAHNQELNQLPHRLLAGHDARAMVLVASRDRPAEVSGCTSFDPQDLRPVAGAESLAQLPAALDIDRLTLCLFRLGPPLVETATARFGSDERIRAEIDDALRRHGDACVAYLITHDNQGPLGELTVFIGGDCHRPDARTLEDMFHRSRDLSRVMLRKAVALFPDIPALHGGKEGQWLVLDSRGHAIALSEETMVALGTAVVPAGIVFSSDLREMRARERKIFDVFPAANHIRPDSASPDVLSGKYWERMCETWHSRGIDPAYFTCLPPHLHGPFSPPSQPTGYGLAAATMRLAQRSFAETTEKLTHRRFLIEALGRVSHYTIEALTRINQVPPGNIVGVDPSEEACSQAVSRFGIRARCARNTDYYRAMGADDHFDVWINNGLGDDVGTEEVQALLGRGIRLFCGAANNFLREADRDRSLEAIFAAGAVAWPDEAASGGGYVMAVMDAFLRCQRLKANTADADRNILETTIGRNRLLVEEAFAVARSLAPSERGRAIWNRVTELIDARVDRARNHPLADDKILAAANVRSWKLPRSGAPQPRRRRPGGR